MTEQQEFELHQALMALDDGSIAFGAIFADVGDIVDVVKAWLNKYYTEKEIILSVKLTKEDIEDIGKNIKEAAEDIKKNNIVEIEHKGVVK